MAGTAQLIGYQHHISKIRLRPDELRHDRIDSLFRVARQEAMVQKVQRVKRINFRCYNVSQMSAITKAFHSHDTRLSTYFSRSHGPKPYKGPSRNNMHREHICEHKTKNTTTILWPAGVVEETWIIFD